MLTTTSCRCPVCFCGECIAPSSIIDADTRAKSQSSLVCLHTIDFLKSVRSIKSNWDVDEVENGPVSKMFRAGIHTQHVEPLAYIIIWIFAPHHPFHSTNRHGSSRPHEKKTLHLVDLSRSRLTLMNSLRSFSTVETDQIAFRESFSLVRSKRNESSKNNKNTTCGGDVAKNCFQNCIIILFWSWLFTWKKKVV